jgi:hypothetical protein
VEGKEKGEQRIRGWFRDQPPTYLLYKLQEHVQGSAEKEKVKDENK